MRAWLKSNLNVRTRRLPGGPQSENHTGDRSDGKSEGQHWQIKCDVLKSRYILWRQANQDIANPCCDEKPQHTAEHGDQKAFQEKLANDLPTRSANGRTDCKLSRSRSPASREKVCHVRTSNQQNHCDSAQ